MKSIFFKYPMLYDWGISFLYFDGMKIIEDIVGPSRSVFEPACGYGRMKEHLHSDCTYSGIDLNEAFIEYGRKKNRDIWLGNVLDPDEFREVDVVLLCDILHHLRVPEMHQLFSLAAKFAKEKVVIVEPTFVDIAARNNPFSRVLGRVMIWVDSDGFNDIERWFSHEERDELYQSLKERNGMKELKVRNFRNHDFVELTVS